MVYLCEVDILRSMTSIHTNLHFLKLFELPIVKMSIKSFVYSILDNKAPEDGQLLRVDIGLDR